MPWNGDKVTRPYSWVQERVDGENINADAHDANDDDIANSISLALRRDGGNSATADINMGNKKLKNVAQGTAVGDAVALINDSGTTKLQAADGSLLTNVVATVSDLTSLDFTTAGEPTIRIERVSADPTDLKIRVVGLTDVLFIIGDTGEVEFKTPITLEDTAKISDGSASAPGVAFDTDPTSGLYRTGTTVGFSAGAQAVWTADASNIVGLGYESGNTAPAIKVTPVESQVNWLGVSGSTTGTPVPLAPLGADANIDLSLTPKGSGSLILDGLRWPTSDGTSGYAVITDGAGQLSFGPASAGPAGPTGPTGPAGPVASYVVEVITETASTTTGSPPELVPVTLDLVTDNAHVYVSSVSLTGDLDVALTLSGVTEGRTCVIERRGDNQGFNFSVSGLASEGVVNLAQGQAALFVFDGVDWNWLPISPLTSSSDMPFSVETVTGNVSLTAARQFHGGAGVLLLTSPATASDAITLTLPDAATVGSWYIMRGATHTGTITVSNESASGSINGTSAASVTIVNSPNAIVLIEAFAQPGGAVQAKASGDLASGTTSFAEHDFNGQKVSGQRASKFARNGAQSLTAGSFPSGSTIINNGTAATWTVPSRLGVSLADCSESIVIHNRGSGAITLSASGVTIKGDTTIPVDGSCCLEWESDGSTEYAWSRAT